MKIKEIIPTYRAGSAACNARLDLIGRRLFDWSGLARSTGYRASAERVFGRPLAPDEAVRTIIADVRSRGDKAVLKYTRAFDRVGLTVSGLAVRPSELKNAHKEVPPAFRKALKAGIRNVTAFQKKILADRGQYQDASFTRRDVPVQRAGIYIPGGTGGETPLASSVYMNVIPAVTAGVREIVVCTPPGPGGRISPYILTALAACGIDKVFRIGGVQAIAAMAFGTATVPAVDIVAGPGNLFVMLAKKEVFGHVGIDLLAGPSEVCIIADRTARPELVAADMLAQVEHDRMASSILVTTSRPLADRVQAALARQAKTLPRRAIAEAALRSYGGLIVVKTLDEAAALANRIAPEHLEIMTASPHAVAERITCAGTVFLGAWTPEAAGDYVAGPSHTLPTGGTARFFSGLSAATFMRSMTMIHLTRPRFAALAGDAAVLAASEGLEAHRISLVIRDA